MKKLKKLKILKFLGMVRDALGGIGGSSLSIFTGISKDIEELKIRKLKIDQNRFKMGLKTIKSTYKNHTVDPNINVPEH